MSTIALSWPVSGGVNQLELLSGDTDSRPFASNDDGSVIVGMSGQAGSPPSSGRPVRWDGTTVTELDTVSGPTAALWLSRDAAIIEGSDRFQDNYTRWTSGGSTGALLAPATGYTGAQSPFVNSGVGVLQNRTSSDDGTIIVGMSTGGTGGDPSIIATVWTNGTPSTLPSSFGGTNGSLSTGCSTDGLFVIGSETQGISEVATYWTSGTSHPLVGTVFNPNLQQAYLCDAAGTIIYGSVFTALGVSSGCYWDGLGSVSVGRYGTLHLLDPLPGAATAGVPSACSETGNICVGSSEDSFGTNFATKWNGVTAVNLGTAPGFLDSTATGCSADGSVVSGWARDIAGAFWPCYWDAANVIHLLPTIADAFDPFQGVALGVSRDGALIWGIGDTPTTPPPPQPTSGDRIRGSLRRTQLPQPPKPSADFMKFQRDMIAWAWTVKARLETDSTVNTRPVGPLVVSTFTMVSTVTGTDDLSNFVATFVSLLQGHGYTVPFDLRTNT